MKNFPLLFDKLYSFTLTTKSYVNYPDEQKQFTIITLLNELDNNDYSFPIIIWDR